MSVFGRFIAWPSVVLCITGSMRGMRRVISSSDSPLACRRIARSRRSAQQSQQLRTTSWHSAAAQVRLLRAQGCLDLVVTGLGSPAEKERHCRLQALQAVQMLQQLCAISVTKADILPISSDSVGLPFTMACTDAQFKSAVKWFLSGCQHAYPAHALHRLTVPLSAAHCANCTSGCLLAPMLTGVSSLIAIWPCKSRQFRSGRRGPARAVVASARHGSRPGRRHDVGWCLARATAHHLHRLLGAMQPCRPSCSIEQLERASAMQPPGTDMPGMRKEVCDRQGQRRALPHPLPCG